MVSRNDPPTKPLRRIHCRQRLTPNPLRRRLCIKQVASDENMISSMFLAAAANASIAECRASTRRPRMSSGRLLNLLPQVEI